MPTYKDIKSMVKDKILALAGMKHCILSTAEVPQGTISIEISSLAESDRLVEILTELDIDHMPSTVSINRDRPFIIYLREEDLIFAVMEKDEEDVEKAENAFKKHISKIEEVTKRFISYNDFIIWYFRSWLPEV